MLHRKIYPKYSTEWLAALYFKWRSIDKIILECRDLPFSQSEIHRKLSSWGIVKSAGRHTSMWESIGFFDLLSTTQGTALEELFAKMPLGFQTSAVTLHRIGRRIKDGVFHRRATALFIENESGEVLLGKENGLLTLPVTYSKLTENSQNAVLRVLQQEVLTNEAIEGRFRENEFVRQLLRSVVCRFTFGVLDIRLSCYSLTLPGILLPNSTRLNELKFYSKEKINKFSFYRPGVLELMNYYFASKEDLNKYSFLTSSLNKSFTEMAPSCQLA